MLVVCVVGCFVCNGVFLVCLLCVLFVCFVCSFAVCCCFFGGGIIVVCVASVCVCMLFLC